MGVFPKLSRRSGVARRRGLALPSAILGLVLLSMLALGIHSMSSVQNTSVKNRESSSRALMLAEAGAAHAAAILRDTLRSTSYTRLLIGSDNVAGTADDGLLVGYGMSGTLAIPAAGKAASGGSYTVRVVDDPGDPVPNVLTDGNSRVLMRCTGITNDNASASVDVLISGVPFPGIAVAGKLKLSGGNLRLRGPCGGAHADSTIDLSGTAYVTDKMKSAQTVSVGGALKDSLGNPMTPLNNQPKLEIPDLNASDFCGTADYVLQSNGFILRKSDNTLHNATSTGKFGWKLSSTSPVKWVDDGGAIAPGSICVEGNLVIGGNPGTSAAPLALSLIVKGSVEISGNPYMKPASGDSIAILADGDVSISGNPSASNENYEGLIYAESQCKISGNPRLESLVLCKNKPNAPGTENYADINEISGDAQIIFGCSGKWAGKRRMVGWMQAIK